MFAVFYFVLGQHQKLVGIASHFALILANEKAHLFVCVRSFRCDFQSRNEAMINRRVVHRRNSFLLSLENLLWGLLRRDFGEFGIIVASDAVKNFLRRITGTERIKTHKPFAADVFDFRVFAVLVDNESHLIHCVKELISAARTAYCNIYGFADCPAHGRSALKLRPPLGIALSFGFWVLDNRKTVLLAEPVADFSHLAVILFRSMILFSVHIRNGIDNKMVVNMRVFIQMCDCQNCNMRSIKKNNDRSNNLSVHP